MPSRAEHRRAVEARIVEIGRRHLAAEGAAGLSLRAVTRDLGMVSSAVYRYVANRDELLTLLLVDAYTEVADAVDAAVAEAGDRPWSERVVVAGRAFRRWAVDDPSRYALLYGSPVPGYEAPAERTVEPGTRVVITLARLVDEGVRAGEVTPAGPVATRDEDLLADLVRVGEEVGLAAGADVLARALTLWAVLVGGTSLEVFGQYGRDTFRDAGALLEQQLRLVLSLLRADP
ncbi:TetR/AcrR family transcriptional regulator [Phycicoccus sonneratiae]|uniref:TetR/AcrR family transcriptional regulator n=1 Tax=Phycicoccus sonneratiae TaxID=2807628 RepID=A0ABS2CN95_9MICO|nr:TetR-like C-terminal domain-containing protein [Phycicoccus sonneraticus]MBM6401245.1 TetR/AcrR family transcriptional regulator [Phycicoccus sonneraticus]